MRKKTTTLRTNETKLASPKAKPTTNGTEKPPCSPDKPPREKRLFQVATGSGCTRGRHPRHARGRHSASTLGRACEPPPPLATKSTTLETAVCSTAHTYVQLQWNQQAVTRRQKRARSTRRHSSRTSPDAPEIAAEEAGKNSDQ